MQPIYASYESSRRLHIFSRGNIFPFMILKTDFRRAYGNVRHDYFVQVIKFMNFPEPFITLIQWIYNAR